MPKNLIRSSGEFSLRDSSAGGRLFKAFLVFLFLMALTLQATTQYIAYLFNNDPSLGTFISFGKIKLYPFYRGAIWLWSLITSYLRTRSHQIASQTASSSMVFAFGLLVTAFFTRFYYFRARYDSLSALHGSAHWATKEEIIESGLLDRRGNPFPEGVVVGGFRAGRNDKSTKILRHHGKEHILCFAPTRSGKGVSLVLPTLLDGWNDSAFIFDIKGENYAGTAGYRKRALGHKILKLDFTDPMAISKGTSATFNPLAEVNLDHAPAAGYVYDGMQPYITYKTDTYNETSTIQQIVAIIIDPQGKGLDDHWARTASSFMLGAITHLLYKAQRENLPCPGISDVLSELTQPGKSWQSIVKGWQAYPHLGMNMSFDENGNLLDPPKPVVHPIVAEEAQTLINKPEKEAGSVLSTVISNLGLFRDPIVSQNSKVSSFKIRQLMYHKDPISLYLVVNPNDQLRLLPLTRLFVTQLVFSLVEKMDFKDGRTAETYNHRLLLLLDEFPSLGRMELFEKALGFIGGYGLKAFIVCQGLTQLTKIYGKDEAIRVGCHIQIAFAPNEVETSEYLSKLTGQMTILKDDVSLTTQEGKLIGGRSKQTTLREVQRPLLTPDECRRLPACKKDVNGDITEAGDMLIFPAGFPPIKGRQTLYFKNNEMNARAKIEPPATSDMLL